MDLKGYGSSCLQGYFYQAQLEFLIPVKYVPYSYINWYNKELDIIIVIRLSSQEGDHGIHENLPLHVCDELTRNAQMILQMLSFGAYREVLAMVSLFSLFIEQFYY